MSARSARDAEKILKSLVKSKTETRLLMSEVNRAEASASRLLTSVTQLARGDVTGILAQLTALGPYGVALATIIGGAVVAYGIYQQVTKEQPTELYFWRYPA